MSDINEPTMPAIPEAAVEAAAIALWNREGGGPDPVPDYIRHDAYATLAAALPHLSIPSAPAQAPGGLVERLALAEMILAHAEDPALAPVAAALSAAIAALSQEQRGAVDYFGALVEKARAAALKASAKFPQPNYVTLKIAEEAGEVVRGAVHYAENRMEWSEVEGEIVQLLAMLIRFVTEGDEVNGVRPPPALAATPVHQESGE